VLAQAVDQPLLVQPRFHEIARKAGVMHRKQVDERLVERLALFQPEEHRSRQRLVDVDAQQFAKGGKPATGISPQAPSSRARLAPLPRRRRMQSLRIAHRLRLAAQEGGQILARLFGKIGGAHQLQFVAGLMSQ
jgi:hypothetical protein